MYALKEEFYTTDFIENLPDGERAELIDGHIYYMAPPSRTHQQILFSAARQISDYIEKNNGQCEVNIAPFGVYIDNDTNNYVEPDITVVCDKSKLDEKGCHGAPDIVVEVVSPSSRQMDYFIKLFRYKDSGVKEYWIIDITKEITTVYNFQEKTVNEYPFGKEILSAVFKDIKITINK